MRWLALSLPLILAIACSNELEGSIDIDGTAFEIDGCESGQRNGFSGVDFIGKDGRRLRLVQMPDGRGQVLLFAGEAVANDFGPCATMAVRPQNSTINNVTNVEGNAAIDCKTEGGGVTGTMQFANCH